MRPRERVVVARATYARALGRARAECTPATWRGLLTAARNLSSAVAAAERVPPAGGRRERGAPAVVLSFGVARSRARDPWSGGGGAGPPPASPPCWRMERWPEMARAWERARALMDESRRLVHASRVLGAELARVWAAPATEAVTPSPSRGRNPPRGTPRPR